MRKTLVILLFACLAAVSLKAWRNMPMPKLHVEGRYLVDENGNRVNLHGIVQTYSPWFNEKNTKWNDYNVDACLRYNMGFAIHCCPGWFGSDAEVESAENTGDIAGGGKKIAVD